MERIDHVEKTIKLKDGFLHSEISIIDDKVSKVIVTRTDRGGGHPSQINCVIPGEFLSSVVKILQHSEKVINGESI